MASSSVTASGPSIPCPKCKKVFKAESWHRDGMPCCQRCLTVFEFVDFPALYQSPENRRATSSSAMPEEASCYFHPSNRAEQVCEGCGRYLCPVCSVDFGGRRLCPSCIEHKQVKAPEGENSRTLWDGIALSLAVLPLLLGIILWPFTILTAPAAICVAIYGWKKPGSLIRGGKVRFIIAIVLAAIQLSVWAFTLVTLIVGKFGHG